jgi:hypothetical protein
MIFPTAKTSDGAKVAGKRVPRNFLQQP